MNGYVMMMYKLQSKQAYCRLDTNIKITIIVNPIGSSQSVQHRLVSILLSNYNPNGHVGNETSCLPHHSAAFLPPILTPVE